MKDFIGYKAEWMDYSNSYIIKFFSLDEVNSFYDIIQSKCYKTNFQIDPYNLNAYGYFKCDNIEYFTSSPVQVNGDNSWYEYPK